MAASKPVIHGRDHLPGGADPVPFLPAAGGDWEGSILGLSGLVGYWRLGEGAAPYRDTSGAGTAADMTVAAGAAGPPAMTQNVTPGLLPAGQDDGAVAFNYQAGTGELTDRLHAGTAKFGFGGTHAYSAVALVKPGASPNSFYGGIVGDLDIVLGSPNWLGGWGLRLHWPAMTVSFARGTGAATFAQAESTALTGGAVYMVAGTYDGTTIRVYVNGTLAASQPDSNILPTTPSFQIGGYSSSSSLWAPFYGVVDEVAVFDRALTDGEVAGLYTAATTDGEGLVLGIDENGDPAWVQPKVEVTVNGETPDTTPNPARPDPVPPPDDTGPDGDDWIQDQPFTWGGPTFQVPPNKWTTIPFTTPLMERHSNVTGGSTTWFELDPDDPSAAGWVDPATPRVITIPHDMEFNPGNFQWFQICLKLEIPPVEDEIFVEGDVTRGSHRGLRVFETTHQKSIVEAFNWRGACCDEHGAIDVFRDPTKHPGLLGDAAMFAFGDPGGEHNLEHGNIMLVPNSGYGYYIPGMDWLPGHASGNPTLKKGMRLVPQVWHNAHETLTFDCTGVLPYRPHFALMTFADRGWGPPWSDWPLSS